jgi:hypothetical protein
MLSRRGTLKQYLEQKKDEGYEVFIPKAIMREVLDEPKELAEEVLQRSPATAKKITESMEAISEAIEHGLVRVETIDYRKYSSIIDNVKKHLSQLEATKEYAVKKGDPELIVLLIQLHDKFKEKIFVSSEDKELLRTLKLSAIESNMKS